MGLNWTEGDMMGEAVKLVWTSWVVLEEGHKRQYGDWVVKALVWLNNVATEGTDNITWKLDQPCSGRSGV